MRTAAPLLQVCLRAVGFWFVPVVGAIVCNAHAGFICTDPWQNTYKLRSAPAGLSCEADESAAHEVSRDQTVAASRFSGVLTLGPTSAPVSGQLLLRIDALSRKPVRQHDGALDALITAAAARYGHPTNLLRAIVHVESRFNTAAVSPKGAIGLMQVMPATATGLGVTDPATRLFDPAVNLDAGARLLRQLLDQFKDRPELAIAAYNAGPGAVLKHGRGIPPYPETQAYVRDVTAEYTRLTR